MDNTRISFGTLFPASEIYPLPTTVTHYKNSQSSESYKQKYLECKENVKQFMLMVEKEFEQLAKKHNEEKQQLKQEIARLKMELADKNDVSNFTVRSKRENQTNSKTERNRSISYDKSQVNAMIFEGISAFDQSKIHSRTKSIVDKNLSSISTPNTLLELENALNSKKSSRISSRDGSTTNEPNQSNSSLNVTQYTNQILSKKTKKLEKSQSKQNFDALMEKMVEKNISSQVQKEKSKFFEEVDEPGTSKKGKLQQRSHNKENMSGDLSNRTQSKSKTQESSVRNLLKNLRSSMKNNIQKQSNLEATTLSSIKV